MNTSRRRIKRRLTALGAPFRRPLPVWVRLVIVLGVAALYFALIHFLLHRIGPISFLLVVIPAALMGWFFGRMAGLFAGLAAIILNTLVLFSLEGSSWITWVTEYWPGNLMALIVGYGAGVVKKDQAERLNVKKELQSRERFLALINLTTKGIIGPRNSEDTYYYTISHLANLFVADHAHLTRWDRDRDQVLLVATTKVLRQPFSDALLTPEEADVTLHALKSGSALIIENAPNSPFIINPSPLNELHLATRSALVIPLLAGEYKFGAAIIAYDSPHHFTREEILYAELASNQIALALWTSEQSVREKKRTKEAITLANIERVLSETERVGLETVLQIIVDSARELIPGAERAVLHLIDDERQVLIPSAVAGYDEQSIPQLNMRLGEGIAGQAITTRETINVPDTMTDPRFLGRQEPARFRSLVVAPIQSNERCLGTISILGQQPNAFSLDESTLLGALGTQASIAIENSRLLETTQRDLKEINALYHINQRLVASLDPDQLMKDVVDLLRQSFGYYHVQIFVVDPASGDLVLRQGSGEIGARLKEEGHRLPIGSGIIGHAVETGEPFFTNAVEKVVFFIRNSLLPNTQSEMTIPIKVENKVLGVLDIQQAPPARLTRRDVQLMMTVAEQLAISLQKANLYTDLQASLTQEKATRSQLIQSERLAVVGRLMASVSHELNNPIQAIQNALFLIQKERGLSQQGKQDLEIVILETERMASLLDRLRVTYRPVSAEEFQPMMINKLIEDVYALIATHLRHNHIAFEFHADPELPPVPGLVDQLRQVLLNLFMNAADAMTGSGVLKVSTCTLEGSREILITVADTGSGIDPDILPNIFDAFVTNKERGTGLGLAISYEIISKHHGRIHAQNNPECGATFSVCLPFEQRGDEP